MSKKLSLRKLKKLEGYHARLFVADELADKWLERMASKMGSDFVFDKRPHKEGSTNLVLAFMHKR